MRRIEELGTPEQYLTKREKVLAVPMTYGKFTEIMGINTLEGISPDKAGFATSFEDNPETVTWRPEKYFLKNVDKVSEEEWFAVEGKQINEA